MLSSTRWASTNFVWSELTVETLASPKHGKIIFTKALLHVSNKRETWLLCFEWIFEWYEDDMAFCVFIVIILRGDGKKRHLDANQFRHCYSNFFRKWRSERYLITAMFKGSSQQLRSSLTTAFLKLGYLSISSIFYGHGLTCVLNLSPRLMKDGKRHWNENRLRCLEKDELRKSSCVHLEEHKIETTFHLF